MPKLDGKVAFITGAARGQGRSHALRLAEEGADIIAVDSCEQFDDVEYPMSTLDDLAHTVKLVEDCGRRILASQADVRDKDGLQKALDDGVHDLGRLDFVVANAGVLPVTLDVGDRQSSWHLAIDVMLTGVLHTIQVSLPAILSGGSGGSIVLTCSTAGLKGLTSTLRMASPGMVGYVAAKHGVVGLMRAYANALASHSIRVNTVHPTGVASPMLLNEAVPRWIEAYPEVGAGLQNALPVELVECVDVANAVCWLCSDESRFVTGAALPVDAGFAVR
jgi:SDR family mycofactocin-dependent oxidoreductase